MNTWIHPPTGFLKLNFYGASRGNPGPVGIGGVLRDSKGEIKHIYSQALGEGTNNEMEFAALEQGLRILRILKSGATVVEGDSQLVVTVARRMYTGAKPSKVTQHWRIAKVTEIIAEHLSCLDNLIFHAVRCKSNIVVDHLANYGIDNPSAHLDTCWKEITCTKLRKRCTLLSRQDIIQRKKRLKGTKTFPICGE